MNLLTISMHAPINVALIFTSKSIGKLIPKLSASVKYSRANPDHFFDILPISLPLKSRIYQLAEIQRWKKLELPKRKLDQSWWRWSFTLKLISLQHDQLQHGPSMRSTVSSIWFFISKFEYQHVHVSATRPITEPGGDDISIVCKQHGKQQPVQASGRLKWMISLLYKSNTFISNGREEPQQLRVQQSVSSTAKYT